VVYQPTYTDFSTAHDAVEAAIADTIRDNPDLTADEVAWDMTQAIMSDCDVATVRELSQRTGVSIPSWLAQNMGMGGEVE
jgi:hypothetical protein